MKSKDPLADPSSKAMEIAPIGDDGFAAMVSRPKQSLARATGLISGLTLISRVLGLIRDVVVGAYFGAGFASDAFFVAFKIPNLLRRLVAEGSLAAAFVPVFTEALARSKHEAKKAIGEATSFCFLLTTSATVLGIFFAEQLTRFFAPGFGSDSEKTALAALLLQIMFPFIIFVSLLAMAGSALNCLNRFALPALGPALLNAVIILFVLLLTPWFSVPVHVLGWAVFAGGIVQLLPVMIQLAKIGLPLHFRSPFQSPVVKKLLILMFPAIFSASIYQIMVFINTVLASLLREGSVSWLYFADRLFQFPHGMFSVALATAVLPRLSKLAQQNNKDGFNQQLTKALNWITFITFPAAAGLFILSEPIVITLYEHGRFTRSDSFQTALCLQGFVVGLWAISSQTILVRAFLAKQNTVIPAIVAAISMFFNIYFALALMGGAVKGDFNAFERSIVYLQETLHIASLGHVGLGLAGSLSSFVSFGLLFTLLRRINVQLNFFVIIWSVTKIALATVVMSVFLHFVATGMIESSLIQLIVGVPGGILVYLFAALAVKTEEAKDSTRYLFQLGTLLKKKL